MKKTRYMNEEKIISKAMNALYKELGPV